LGAEGGLPCSGDELAAAGVVALVGGGEGLAGEGVLVGVVAGGCFLGD